VRRFAWVLALGPGVAADQWNEAALAMTHVLPPVACRAPPYLEVLQARTSYGYHENTPLIELIEQRSRDAGCRSAHEDPSIGGVLLPPEAPVTVS